MAWIGSCRRASIADKRNLRTLLELDDDFRGAGDFVVLVIAHGAGLNFEMRE